ncbi:MAG: hypothetical protein RQ862_06805 [Candidatus Caldarchaeales archaeon]|nr:hypothetical protein [Candidatus Caldarchaeales archaeon]
MILGQNTIGNTVPAHSHIHTKPHYTAPLIRQSLNPKTLEDGSPQITPRI